LEHPELLVIQVKRDSQDHRVLRVHSVPLGYRGVQGLLVRQGLQDHKVM